MNNKTEKRTSAASVKPKVSKEMVNSKFYKLFVDGLKDIYWAEKHLVKELPKMSKAATSSELKMAIDSHLEETRGHVTRLEDVFENIGLRPQAKKCEAMAGLVKEAQEIIEETTDDTMVRDCGIIMAAQKVEHYEIATYGSLVAWAKKMDHKKAADLLYATLEEEKLADEKLTEVAEDDVNEQGSEE